MGVPHRKERTSALLFCGVFYFYSLNNSREVNLLLDKKREHLEDMIVAILLGNSKITRKPNGRCLYFKIDDRKTDILYSYLEGFRLEDQFNIDTWTGDFYVKPSIMLENVLKNWVLDDKVEVIDPLTLRLNAYYIWISLFGEKKPNGVSILTNLDSSLQYTLTELFKQQFGTKVYQGNTMHIKPFSPIVLHAFKSNRPLQESMELTYLLPFKEKEGIKKLVLEWENERATYAY